MICDEGFWNGLDQLEDSELSPAETDQNHKSARIASNPSVDAVN
jgi:hypothetical protein